MKGFVQFYLLACKAFVIRFVTPYYKYHHLTTTLHLTLKMTTAQVVEMSVTNNSLSKDYLHPDDHDKPITPNYLSSSNSYNV